MNDFKLKTPLNDLAHEIHINAEQHGFWEVPLPTFGDSLLLVTTEITEAFEEFRNHHDVEEIYYICKMHIRPNTIATKEMCFGCVHGMETFGNKCSENVKKPEGVPVELADALIRILDIAGYYGLDMDKIVEEKMVYNSFRPYKHGKKL